MNRAEIKQKSKADIAGKIGILFVIELIIAAISGVAGGLLSMIPGGGLVATIIITPAFTLSSARVFLMVVRGDTPEVSHAFCGFDDFFAAFKVTFLVGLFTFLWSLLFIIPGIVKSYAYSMAIYILADNKGKSARECIAESQEMTKGHKAELFVLHLSFIGWIFLSILTLGIALIWVVPYMNAAYANAYETLKPAPEVLCEIPEHAAVEDTTEEVQ